MAQVFHVNFGTAPDGTPIANGTVVDTLYSTWGVTFAAIRCDLCGVDSNVYANANCLIGRPISAPNVVTFYDIHSCSDISEAGHGLVQATLIFWSGSRALLEPKHSSPRTTFKEFVACWTLTGSMPRHNFAAALAIVPPKRAAQRLALDSGGRQPPILFGMMKKAMSDRRLFLWPASLAAFFGVLAFFRVASKPRFETFHVLDVIGLMTAGAGLAVALIMLILFFTRGPRTEDNRAREKSGEESN